MKAIIRAIWQLFTYLFIGLLPLLMVFPVWLILGKQRAFKYAIAVDLLVCVFAHGEFRTISGMTGSKARFHKRYEYQELVINALLKSFDGVNHCKRADIWERSINYNYFKFFRG